MAMRTGVSVIDAFLKAMFKQGRLTLTDSKGRTNTYGDGDGDGAGEEVVVRLHGDAERRLLANASLALGECYAEGLIEITKGDIYDLMDLIGRNRGAAPKRHTLVRSAHIALKRRLQQMNNRVASLRNVSHHYDLSHELYRRFLDADMQYSCAYYGDPDVTLENAQAAKKAHLAAKLLLRPGQKVLDIGCGWGGLAMSIAQAEPGVTVLGVTLSKEQLAVAQRRAEAAGLSDRVSFELRDYRDVPGPFDRIISVGMFEHVGQPHYQEFFDHIDRLLTDDGVMVLHSIGRRDGPGTTNPFINKYIFPGGYSPALSEVLPKIERTALWVTDIEILRLHYAETLKAWRKRFLAHWDEVAAVYDERFCRLWDYYLASSEISFRWLNQMNFQIQMAKRVDTVPMTRDYIGEAERRILAVTPIPANTDAKQGAAA